MKKIYALIVITGLTISLAACGGKKFANDENTLEIYAIEAGYGVKWLEALIDRFEDLNPQYNVELWTDIGVERGRLLIQSGPSNTTADLLFTNEDYYDMIYRGDKELSGYDFILEDLTDLYNSKVPGEDVLYKDKVMDSLLRDFTMNEASTNWEDKQFFAPWGYGVSGLLYNNLEFDKLNLELPRTTLELIDLSDQIKQAGKMPFVSSRSAGYWDYLVTDWWQQYETVEGYAKFWNPTRVSDYRNYNQEGRLFMLQTMNQLLKPEYGRSHANSLQYSFTEAQARFVAKDGWMIPSGDWFFNEMQVLIDEVEDRGESFDARILQTPVISALSNKLSYWDTTYDYKSLFKIGFEEGELGAKTTLYYADENLSKLVDFIDKGEVGEKPKTYRDSSGVTYTATEEVVNNDLSIVREARRVQRIDGTGQTAVIPAYATAKEAAKKFIQFMATDEGIEIYAKNVRGGTAPYKYDYKNSDLWNDFDDFTKNKIELMEKTSGGTYWPYTKGTWLVGLRAFSVGTTTFMNTGSSYQTPMELFEVSKMSESEFRILLQNAGLL